MWYGQTARIPGSAASTLDRQSAAPCVPAVGASTAAGSDRTLAAGGTPSSWAANTDFVVVAASGTAEARRRTARKSARPEATIGPRHGHPGLEGIDTIPHRPRTPLKAFKRSAAFGTSAMPRLSD